MPARSGVAPIVLTGTDGWKHINLEASPNASGYGYRMALLFTPLGGQLWFALPKLVFGHINLDPNLGALMAAQEWTGWLNRYVLQWRWGQVE